MKQYFGLYPQLKVLGMPDGSRYTPLKDINNGGLILLKDVTPGEKEDIVEPVASKMIF